MQTVLDRIRTGEVLVADGALGTMLLQSGLAAGQCPESLNLSQPETLGEIAHAYLEAGADIMQTNTFGASPIKLSQYGLEDKTEIINIAAVQAVRKSIGNRAYISASIGPCGKILEPYGDAEPEEVLESFQRQIAALAGQGIHLICVETMTDLEEAKLAVKAAKAIAPFIPVSATMTFDRTPRGFFTIMGVTVKNAARELALAGADIVGSNCGNGIMNMVKIAAEFKESIDLPVMIQSNAGIPEVQVDKLVYPETPEYMANACRTLLQTGVSIVGGCCGTTPAHIAAIRKVVDEFARL